MEPNSLQKKILVPVLKNQTQFQVTWIKTSD
jgi:hypothetical protein